MRADNFNIDELVAHLQGSCNSLDTAISEMYPDMDYDDLSDDDFFKIDNEVFECANCGWWCEVGEAHGADMGDICDDCYKEEQGEEQGED